MAIRKGRRFEYTVRDYLRCMGYEVIRSAGSRGPADLLAGDGRHVLAIQCKINGDIRPRERERLVEFARKFRAMPVLAFKGKKGVEFRYVHPSRCTVNKELLDALRIRH